MPQECGPDSEEAVDSEWISVHGCCDVSPGPAKRDQVIEPQVRPMLFDGCSIPYHSQVWFFCARFVNDVRKFASRSTSIVTVGLTAPGVQLGSGARLLVVLILLIRGARISDAADASPAFSREQKAQRHCRAT
jgi:hypothetical protein